MKKEYIFLVFKIFSLVFTIFNVVYWSGEYMNQGLTNEDSFFYKKSKIINSIFNEYINAVPSFKPVFVVDYENSIKTLVLYSGLFTLGLFFLHNFLKFGFFGTWTNVTFIFTFPYLLLWVASQWHTKRDIMILTQLLIDLFIAYLGQLLGLVKNPSESIFYFSYTVLLRSMLIILLVQKIFFFVKRYRSAVLLLFVFFSFAYCESKFLGEDLESNQIYLRARYYDVENGVFISRDPIGIISGNNSYQYVNNNSVNSVDPSGLLTIFVPGTNVGTGNIKDTDILLADETFPSDFRTTVAETLKDPSSIIFTWSGSNTDAARQVAGNDLARLIASIKVNNPNEVVNVVGHSHGGNVSLIASQKSGVTIDNLYTLGTPSRSDYTAGLGVRNVVSISSSSDWVQKKGGTDFSPLKFGSATRDIPYATNILLSGYGHSDLHTSDAWRDAGSIQSLTPLPAITSSSNSLWNYTPFSSSFNLGGVLIDKAATLIGSNLSDIKGATYDPVSKQLVFLGTNDPAAVKDIDLDYFYTAVNAVYGSAVPPFVTLDPPVSLYTQWSDYGDGDGTFEPGEWGGVYIRYNPIWAEEDGTIDLKVTLRSSRQILEIPFSHTKPPKAQGFLPIIQKNAIFTTEETEVHRGFNVKNSENFLQKGNLNHNPINTVSSCVASLRRCGKFVFEVLTSWSSCLSVRPVFNGFDWFLIPCLLSIFWLSRRSRNGGGWSSRFFDPVLKSAHIGEIGGLTILETFDYDVFGTVRE